MPAIVRTVRDERDALLTFLEHERHVLAIAAYGLTDEQARLTPTVSDMSIEFLLVHMTSTERTWAAMVLGSTRGPDDDVTSIERVLAEYHEATTDDRRGHRIGRRPRSRGAGTGGHALGCARHRVVGALGPAPSHPRDRAPRRPRRHHPRVDRRCEGIAAHGRGRAVATAPDHHPVEAAGGVSLRARST